jgi:hypothetical protein
LFFFLYFRVLFAPFKVSKLIPFLFCAAWIIVAATAGHLIYSAINAPYLAVLLLAMLTPQSYRVPVAQAELPDMPSVRPI